MRLLIVCLLLIILLSGCGSSGLTGTIAAEDRFAMGKEKYDDEDYLEAIDEFQIVKIQYAGSAVADDAQFYLGECNYQMEQYLIAIEEYRALRRNMASSPLAPAAQFQIGMSYYELSPGSTLDQSFTRQAIDQFQAFVEYYPLDERRAEAEDKIRELNGRLALKLFESAEQYMKLGYYRSAGIYYDLVTQQYHDSPYAEEAYAGKIRSLLIRGRNDEARIEIDRLLDRFPESEFQSEFEEHRKSRADRSADKPVVDPELQSDN